MAGTLILKVKGKKGVVTHTYKEGVKMNDASFWNKRKGTTMYATSEGDVRRYGGKTATVVSAKIMMPKKKKQNNPFNMGYKPW